jgi:hypothetical protein
MFVAAVSLIAAAFVSTTARAEVVTLQCSGDVSGTFAFDLAGGTGATFEDNHSTALSEVEISREAIVFTNDPVGTDRADSASRFRLDRQTDKIDRETYQYVDNKMVGSSHAIGQCKQVPNQPKTQ